jgi:hypothetical protein
MIRIVPYRFLGTAQELKLAEAYVEGCAAQRAILRSLSRRRHRKVLVIEDKRPGNRYHFFDMCYF